jgi:LytS/YehU family sensor histidine kinase
VIHGVIPRGAEGNIEIHFGRLQNQLVVTVRDNGIGRKKAIERRSQQDQHHKSTALLVVQERLELLDGKTHIEIIDLEDEQGNASGTEVRVSLPWENLGV